MAFTIDMSSPFRSGWRGGLGGPNSGGHGPPNWYIQFGMDLGVAEGTEVWAAFAGHVTKFQPHTPRSDTSKIYGAQLFMRSDNDMMGGFYTHITDSTFSAGQQINRGDRLGVTLKDHLHFALVEIIGGAPHGRYMGVDLYRHFVAMADQPRFISVTFKQNVSPPDVTPSGSFPVPAPNWLLGWWEVEFQGDTYYYYFDLTHQVKWSTYRPRDTMTRMLATDGGMGTFAATNRGDVTIQWRSGSVEKFSRSSSSGGERLTGTWNDNAPITAVRMS